MTSTGVLEGVLVAIVAVSAVTFVVSYDNPESSLVALDRLTDVRANDFLRIANDFPLQASPCGGLTVADQMVIEAFGQSGSTWKTRRDRYFGPGVDTNLYVLNGRGTMPIYQNYDFKAVAVTAPWTPQFHWVKPVATTGWTGSEDVQLQLAPINFGEVTRMRGDAIRFTAESSNGINKQQSVSWSPIAMRIHAEAPSQFSWTGASTSDLIRPLTPVEMAQTAAGEPLSQRIRLGDESDETVFAGTSLTITGPSGWEIDLASVRVKNPSWRIDGRDGPETGIVATLLSDVSAPYIFGLDLSPPPTTTRPYDTFHAILGGGSFARSSLIFTFPHAVDAEVPRELFPTVPYPVAAGSTALLGAAFANGPEAITLTQFDIEIPGGYDLGRHDGEGAELFLSGIEPVIPADADVTDARGWQWIDARHIRWTGEIDVPARGAARFLVRVPITEDASQETSVESLVTEPTRTTLTFANGFSDTSWDWSQSPGLIRHRLAPESEGGDGYPFLPTDDTSFVAQVRRPGVNVTQEWSYEVATDASLLKLQNGVTNSSFQVLDRSVPLGTVVQAEGDLQSIFTALAGQGVQDATVNVGLYAPPSMGCVPTRGWETSAGSLATARTNDMALWSPEGVAGGLFLSAADRSLYRIEPGGAPRWAEKHAFEPGAFLTAQDGAERVLFGTWANGSVFRASAATGVIERTLELDGTAVRALDLHPSEPVLVATTSTGSFHLLSWDLAILGSYDSTTFRSVVFDDDGTLLALNGTQMPTVERYLATLQQVARSVQLEALGVRAIAPNPQRILFSHELGWDALDADTLERGPGVPAFSHKVTHDAVGDVDGDGVLDLAMVAGETLYLVNGATLQVTSRTPDFRTDGSKGDKNVWSVGGAVCRRDPDFDEGSARSVQDVYGSSPVCNPHELSGPLVLQIEAGRVLYGFAQAEQAHLCVLESDLVTGWCRVPLPHLVPAGFARGPYAAFPNAVAVAYTDGTIEIRADATGDVLETLHPTQTAGRFTIRFPIPISGFFGAHVLVATVHWEQAGESRSVSLADWFQVVDVDGRPISRPMYTLVLVARDLSEGSRDP